MIELDYLFGCWVEVDHWRRLWDFQSFLACLSLLSQHQYIDEILHASDTDAVQRAILE